MPLVAYIPKNFRSSTLAIIEQANQIINEYQSAGYSLTLRQLYYQFVSRDLIANKQTEYKRLGSIINDARLAGLIDWEAIEDRTRNLQKTSTWSSPNDILQSAASSYKSDLWKNQEHYVEVWIEKDALVGVIEQPCELWRVPFFACRGYTSQSEQWEAGQRLGNQINRGKTVHVLHLGDHDPSGLDMTRDNDDRLRMFIDEDSDGSQFNIHRLALNMNQVRKYNPPPNPAKDTDSRFEEYRRVHGSKSWELDALNPQVISTLIETNIKEFIDFSQWNSDRDIEDTQISKLYEIASMEFNKDE